MGKVTGFLETDRKGASRRPAALRVLDWHEFYGERTEQDARVQAGRCMDCGVPLCQSGCPLGNPIPDFNDAVYRDRWQSAHRRLDATNNFPEFTGRLCPAPCEAACVLTINRDPVTIEEIEKEIAERAFREGWVRPWPPASSSGKRVAIVGSGPAGLACAQQLRRAGHEVWVFERDAQLGGLLRYGIPDFKLEKWVLTRRLELLAEEGIHFRTGVTVGVDVPWSELHREHDALVVAIGAQLPRDFDVPGRELGGVHFAMDYLCQQNRVLAAEPFSGPRIDARDKHVVILGGGDTGSDCLGTALRQGAASVSQLELLPRPPDGDNPQTPWPHWPLVFRTSSSQEEGGAREWAVLTERLEGMGGHVERLHAVRMHSRREGERWVLDRVPGSEFEIPAELVLLAIGFAGPCAEGLRDELGVRLDARGNMDIDDRFATSVPGLWAIGDASRGASLIVWAIADGRQAAACIDASLRAAT